MNRPPAGSHDADAAPLLDLARTAPFRLAGVTVTPAALLLEGSSWSHRLEPRAMQVLVVLAEASPEVVGRATLNARVWGGRIVGDDAINRAVQTLRRIAADAPLPPPFAIATIPRVGYRLLPADAGVPSSSAAGPGGVGPADSHARAPAAATRGGPLLRWVAAAAVLASVAAAVTWRRSNTDAAARGWRIVGSTMLDDLPADAGDLAMSPDGKRLAYRGRDAQGVERIFVRAVIDGGTGAPVSPAAFDAHRPAWSPDGAALAFSTYDPGAPCRLFVLRGDLRARSVGACETEREPQLAWSRDGRALLFGDAPGWNAVPRISSVGLADGRRMVLSSPPGDSMGDALPMPLGHDIVFQRQFGWSDVGWIARDPTTGRERSLWRRRGIAGTVAAPLPDGALAVAWTRAGASGLDVVRRDGRVTSQPTALGVVTAISAAGTRLLVATDRSESALARADDAGSSAPPLGTVRGRIAGPALLPDGRLRFPVTSAGVARIWERDAAGTLRPWSSFTAARIFGLEPSPSGRWTAALVTGDAGRGIVLFDAVGKPVFRWSPHARSLNPAVWSGDGRHLLVPVLDGAGWRLFALDPFNGEPPRDVGLPGFAVLQSRGSALYAVRAGETTGPRELWRLDGRVHRLPIDLTLLDIVNWRAVDRGVWLPERGDGEHPRLVLRALETGRVLRRLAAPTLAGAGSGMAADARGPVYVRAAREAPEYRLLIMSGAGRDGSAATAP